MAQTATVTIMPTRTVTPAPGAVEALVPSPEMRKLEWMVGSWQVLETHETRDWGPSGGGRGSQTVSLGPGGFSLLTDYRSSGPQGQISGHGILTWDTEKRGYALYLADSVTPGVIELTCLWRKEDLVCDGRAQFLGTPIFVRWTMSEIGANSYSGTFETSVDGRSYRPAVMLRYTRSP
ncbi:MAG: hypothetical protein ABR576_02765 [Thermoanaerobaculia bacterium]